jgi:hypothetical protein
MDTLEGAALLTFLLPQLAILQTSSAAQKKVVIRRAFTA